MKSKGCDGKDNDEKEKIDKYIINLEVSLGNMEKVGVAFWWLVIQIIYMLLI